MSPYIFPGLTINRMTLIVDCVLKYKGFENLDQVIIKSRVRNIAYTRQLIAYLLCMHTSYTLKAIGEILGGQDHTTVIHGREAIRGLLRVDPFVNNDIKTLTGIIKNKMWLR